MEVLQGSDVPSLGVLIRGSLLDHSLPDPHLPLCAFEARVKGEGKGERKGDVILIGSHNISSLIEGCRVSLCRLSNDLDPPKGKMGI